MVKQTNDRDTSLLFKWSGSLEGRDGVVREGHERDGKLSCSKTGKDRKEGERTVYSIFQPIQVEETPSKKPMVLKTFPNKDI